MTVALLLSDDLHFTQIHSLKIYSSSDFKNMSMCLPCPHTPVLTSHRCYQLIEKNLLLHLFMLRLHYVPGGHGSHKFGHPVRDRVTVTQSRGTGSTNVARCGRRDKILNSQKNCHGGIDLLKCAVVERGKRNKT